MPLPGHSGSGKTTLLQFMGSNNRLNGKVTEVQARTIEGCGWALWGQAGAGIQTGQDGTAVIRVERIRIANVAGKTA